MRGRALLLTILAVPSGTSAQEAPPSELAAVELARSRACVPVLHQLDEVDRKLQPLAARSQRLGAVAQAIALEERSIVDSLDVSDPTQAAVRAWFVSDGELAKRFADTRDEAIQEQRSAAREVIKTTVTEALAAIQTEANSVLDASGDLAARASPCDGAILVRPAVLEVCATESGPVCDEATATEPTGRYRIIDTPEDLWDVTEFRPWTEPGPLQVAPDGQLTGARTIGYTRRGNVGVTVAFAPLLQEKDNLTPEQLTRFEAIDDTLDFDFDHPTLAFAPSLGIRATLPEPLAGETRYVVHFGSPEEAEILWSGPAGTGAPIDATIIMSPSHVAQLASGSPIYLTAVVGVEEGDNEAVFTIQVSPVNQGRSVTALAGYMRRQLGLDLAQLVSEGGDSRMRPSNSAER